MNDSQTQPSVVKSFIAEAMQEFIFSFLSVTGLLKPQPVSNHQLKNIVSPLLITTDAHITLMTKRLK